MTHRIAVVTDRARYFDKEDVLTAIDAIPYPASVTRTSLGLKKVREDLFQEANGMRPDSMGIKRVLLVLTDGQATNGYTVRHQACR